MDSLVLIILVGLHRFKREVQFRTVIHFNTLLSTFLVPILSCFTVDTHCFVLLFKGGTWGTRGRSDQMRKGSVHCSWHGIRWIGRHSLEKSNHAKEASWENLRKINQAVEISMNFHRHVSVRDHSICLTSQAKRTNIRFQEGIRLSRSQDIPTYPIAVTWNKRALRNSMKRA